MKLEPCKSVPSLPAAATTGQPLICSGCVGHCDCWQHMFVSMNKLTTLCECSTIVSATKKTCVVDTYQQCATCVGGAVKPAGKEPLEQLLPELITFLLTHPHVKSMKQVGRLAMLAMALQYQHSFVCTACWHAPCYGGMQCTQGTAAWHKMPVSNENNTQWILCT